MEGYFAQVVERLTGAGYRWYETANFCRDGGRDLRSRHNLAYWLGRDYLGIGVGAVSTVAGRRWRNTPRLPAYLEALEGRSSPLREVEELDEDVRARAGDVGPAPGRAVRGERGGAGSGPGRGGPAHPTRPARVPSGELRLTRRGRFLGGVTAELLA